MIPDYGTLPEMIRGQADRNGDETFLIRAETGETFSYQEIDARSDEVAATLAERGVVAGDKVGVILPNSAALVVAICGVLKVGGVVVPTNPEYKTGEIAYVFEQSDSQLVITEESLRKTVEKAIDDIGVKALLTPEECEANANESRSTVPKREVRPVDTALLMFTSGTTGDPKSVALSHLNLLFRFDGGEMPRGYGVFYTVLPLFNIDGFITTLGTMYDGGQVLLRNGFSASSFWADVEQYDANITSVVPSVLAILLEREYPENRDVSSFERFVVSGSYVHEELVERFEEAFGINVMEIYGLTEAAGTAYESPEEVVVGSAGSPTLYAEAAILDEDTSEPLPPGELGEIVLRGPTVFKEYYNNPEATEEVLQGGWFHTEDIGYVDKEGRCYVKDRIKNIIIRGGQNIYPGEIEEAIHAHPAVEDVAVVGHEHEIYGEVPVAYVTIDEHTDEKALEKRIREDCTERFADFKIPEAVYILEEFPRGETGKILKERL
ncbi:class I adenylate-forming enzyme family protein [Halomarina halobia]|uniref:Class I adenylate-forming enzyme family protein n=1 Tax=Halomarina halobia TaxID=3033386 RepID=A0ABD6AF29_9EURY|nr:class I adenylate-forming enzyme family protein [Halomarina sp. PSR21]